MDARNSLRGGFAHLVALLLGASLLAIPAAAHAGDPVPPTANDDSYAYYWGTTVTLNVLANDTSSDGGALSVYDVSFDNSTDDNAGTQVYVQDGQVKFNPCACAQYKTITFQYRAAEGSAISDWATVSFYIKAPKPVTYKRHHKRLRFKNPNDFTVKVTIYWHGSTVPDHKNVSFKIAPGGTAVTRRYHMPRGYYTNYNATRRPHHWRTPVYSDWVF